MKSLHNLKSIAFLDMECIANPEATDEQINLFCDVESKKSNGIELPFFGKLYFQEKAALKSEFGKIVCISIGYFNDFFGQEITIKSFTDIDEKKLIEDFFFEINNIEKSGLGGHNIKEFDIPYIAQRACINGIMNVPYMFDMAGKKPWEINWICDTFEMWKCGKFSGSGSLQALCMAFKIPNPKSEVDGSNVWQMYNNAEYEKIAKYCEGDVIASIRLFQKMTTGTTTI